MKLSRLIIPIIIGLAIGGAGFMMIVNRKNKLMESPIGNKNPSIATTVTPKSTKLLTWIDPAGFTFQYPDGLTINKHEEDSKNYAHVEFTSKDHPGNLIVWAKDSNDDLSSWIKNDKRFKNASVIDTTFARIDGKKILVASPSAMMITGTISDAVLFDVEANLIDKNFWSKVHDTITGSFAFIPDNSGQSGSSAGSADTSADEEETIQ